MREDTGKVPAGPPLWICGDCHLGNLGPLADADGNVDVRVLGGIGVLRRFATQDDALFVPQRFDRIDTHRTPRGKR